MGSDAYTNKGAKSTNRPRIDPSAIVTIMDTRHPRHAARNSFEYAVGNSLFESLVSDWMSDVGFTNAPRAAWVETDKKNKTGYWLAVDGNKRFLAAVEGNRRLVQAGGLPKDIAYDADIGQSMALTAVKGIAAQYTRTIESAYTTARDIATLIGRPWGGEDTGNEGSMDEALERIRYRGKRVSRDMAEQALHVTRGFPNASALLIEAMHGGLAWSAALRLSCKAQDEQDLVLTAILKGKAPFLAAGGHPDEFWETVTARDVAAAKTGSFEVPTFVPAVGASETTTEAAPTDGEAPPVKPAPGARPERVKAKPAAPAQPRIKTAVAKAMYEAAQTEIKTATGKALTEMRAVLALLATLAGETADDADQVQSMDRLYKIARTVQE
jgi:hypothetical protein